MVDRSFFPTLGDRLTRWRQRRCVGRVSEVELFRIALDSAEPPYSVLYLHGPGGIGKTTLLDRYADIADRAGAGLVRVDGRDVDPDPGALLDALRGVVDVSDGSDAAGRVDRQGGVVVLLDTYERLLPLDEWLRTWLLPRLPATPTRHRSARGVSRHRSTSPVRPIPPALPRLGHNSKQKLDRCAARP